MQQPITTEDMQKANLEQYEAAIEDYDEAIRLEPDYATTYHNRGLAKDALGQYEAAIADYDEAIRLNPDYATVYTTEDLQRTHYSDNRRLRLMIMMRQYD